MFKKIPPLTVFLLTVLIAVLPVSSQAAGNSTVRASVTVGGQESNGYSFNAAISANGRYVAFDSYADNLVSDINNVRDVFVKDLTTNLVSRVSVASDGTPGNHESREPAISRNGRYVAFQSAAANLVANDTNNASDIFVRDTVANTTTRVSLAWDGSQPNASSYTPSISDDGRYVAFASDADNLVPGDTNLSPDIFVRDLQTGEILLASLARNGLFIVQANGPSYNPVISSDGSVVVYESFATNLVSGDNNGNLDVFATIPQLAYTSRVSVSSSGTEASGASKHAAMSGDGRFIAFASDAGNLVTGDNNFAYDIFVRDTVNNTTVRVSLATNGAEGNGDSLNPSISDDGRFVAFESIASNLIPNDSNSLTDVFVRDLAMNVTLRASVASNGAQGNRGSLVPAISANGHFVAFESNADNLVANDNNASSDIFRRTIVETATLRSTGNQDGWIVESSENSNQGGIMDSLSSTFRLGDDAAKRQYRGVLSFATGPSLPDNAVITKVTLRLKQQGVVGGGNPITIFQGLMADIRKGSFGIAALQLTDWQVKANKTIGPFTPLLTGGWYDIDLTSAKAVINKLATGGGVTQIRLRFQLDDNNNAITNYLSLYSGNAGAATRPQLIIEYYVP